MTTDGSLIFNTKIDNTDFNRQINSVNKTFSTSSNRIKRILSDTERTAKSKTAAIAAEYKKMGQSQSEAFKNAWEAVRNGSEQFENDMHESFKTILNNVDDSNKSMDDSLKEFSDNLMQSSGLISMAVKLAVSEFKMLADAAVNVASITGNSFAKVAEGIGEATAQVGKFTLKQFVGDWENNSGGLKKLLAAAASVFSVYKLFNLGKEGIELGSDLSEVQNVVDVTFSHMTDKVDEWAKKAQKSYGLSETMAKKYIGLYGSMSEAFGFTEQQAFEMSSTLAGLAGDVASFYNIDQDLAYTKLKSVFSGETETLKDLGIVMTENALDNYAMSKGMGKTVAQMSEAEKVALRYNFVLEQLNNAAGDFTRTQDSWANQTRLLSLRWDTLKATIGRGLINALTPALKLVNRLIEGLQSVADWFESFSTAIFGNSFESTGAMTEGLETAADNVEELGDSLEDVAKKGEKLKCGLAVFDELNVMTDNESDNESAEEIVNNVAEASGIIDDIVKDTKNSAESTLKNIEFSKSVQEAIKKGNWRRVGSLLADYVSQGLKNIKWDVIKPKAVLIAENIGGFINGVFESPNLWINIGHTISEGLNTAILFVLSLLRTIDFSKIGFDLAKMANEFLETFDAENYGALAAEKINAVFDFLAGFAFDFDWSALGDKIGETLASYFQNLNLTEGGKSGKTIPETIAGIINGLIQAGIQLFTYEFTDENGEVHNLWEYIGATLGEGLNAFLKDFSIGDAVEFIKQGIKAFLSTIYNAFVTISGEDGNGFKNLGAELAEEVNGWLDDDEWWKSIGTMLGEIINDILDFAITFIGGIDNSKLSEALGNLFGSLDVGEISGKIITVISSVFYQVYKSTLGKLPIFSFSETIILSVKSITDKIIFYLSDLWEKISGGAVEAWEGIKDVFSHVTDWFSGLWEKINTSFHTVFDPWVEIFNRARNLVSEKIIEPVKTFFSGLWEKISGGASEAWEGVKKAFSPVVDWFKNVFSEAWQKVKDVFSKGGEIFTGIKEGIESTFKTVVNGLIDGINFIVKKAFDGLNNALTTMHNIEILGVKPFEWVTTFDVPQIPRLATGTVVPASYGEFLAVLGDNKREPEVVSPVSKIEEAVENVLARHGFAGFDRPIYVTVVTEDGTVLFKTVGEENDRYKKMYGKSRFV